MEDSREPRPDWSGSVLWPENGSRIDAANVGVKAALSTAIHSVHGRLSIALLCELHQATCPAGPISDSHILRRIRCGRAVLHELAHPHWEFGAGNLSLGRAAGRRTMGGDYGGSALLNLVLASLCRVPADRRPLPKNNLFKARTVHRLVGAGSCPFPTISSCSSSKADESGVQNQTDWRASMKAALAGLRQSLLPRTAETPVSCGERCCNLVVPRPLHGCVYGYERICRSVVGEISLRSEDQFRGESDDQATLRPVRDKG